MRRIRFGIGLVAVALGALGLAAATNAEPISGGKTFLLPDEQTLEQLAAANIQVEVTGRARAGEKGVKFPVTGGEVDADKPGGSITHAGGLRFVIEGGPSVKFSKFVIVRRATKFKLFAKSGGAEVRFLDLLLAEGTTGSSERSFVIQDADAVLAREGAEVLSTTFGAPFEKGSPAGTVDSRARFGGADESSRRR